MQDIPGINKTESAFTGHAMNQTEAQAFSSDLFSQFMELHMTLVENNHNFAPEPNLDSMTTPEPDLAPVEDSTAEAAPEPNPYNDMRDIRIEKEDLEAMKPQLEQYGLSESDIETLQEKVESEEGLTWGEYVSFLSEKMADLRRVNEFSSTQRQKLMTFFQKMGFTGPDAKKMVNELEEGNIDKVLSAMNKQLQNMPQDKALALDKDELKAFMKEFQELKDKLDSRELGLVKAVNDAMQKAKSRILNKALADNGENGLNQDSDTLSGKESGSKTQAALDNLIRKNASASDQVRHAMDNAEAQIAKGVKLTEHKGEDHFLNNQNQNPEQETEWNEFFARLRLDKPGNSSSVFKTDSLEAAASKEALAEALTQSRETAKAWEKVSAPKVMRQLDDAIFKNLGQGTKQLTLHLRPEELGSLSIMMQVKDKEVHATIRAESPEAAKLIADQLDSIRQSLEEQGLKVQKLEVQTQLPGQNSQEWLGQDSHNKTFEQEAMARMRNHLRLMRESEAGSGPDMNLVREKILASGNGIHVVA